MDETMSSEQPRRTDSGAEPISRTRPGAHHGSRRRSRSARGRTVALAAGVGALIVFLVLVIYLLSTVTRYSSELGAQRTTLESSEAELRDARRQMKQIRSEMDALVRQRLPHLASLEFDRVLRVKQPYIRSVLFSGAQSAEREDYKFTIILENVDLPPAMLSVRVLLFDRSGVQVGGATLDNIGMLRPGEQRTLSGDAQLFMAKVPEYFYIDSGAD